jgi:outer membrane receptor for monomeric catechols
MKGLARRNQADTSLAWFLNGVRVSYAIFRRLDGNSIESIDVIKGPAAEQKYGTPPGHGVIAVWTKGAAPK